MTIFYALGGGWGHLYRVRTFIDQKQIPDYKVLTANPVAHRFFDEEHLLIVDANAGSSAADLAAAIREKLVGVQVSVFYVDTFPQGILGELPEVIDPIWACYGLARRIIWSEYLPMLEGRPIKYRMVYAVEPLHPSQMAWYANHDTEVLPLVLRYPQANPRRIEDEALALEGPRWLIVHTSKEDELESLLGYARQSAMAAGENPSWIVLSDQEIALPGPGLVRPDWPAVDWFPLVDRIFCGGGFNTLAQVQAYRKKVKAIPFPRRFDDQAERIRRVLGETKPAFKDQSQRA